MSDNLLKFIKALFFVWLFSLLIWPFIAFGSMFIFDSPIKSTADMLLRKTMYYSVLSYPFFVFVSFILSRKKFWGKDHKHIKKLVILPAAPILVFFVASYFIA